MRPLHNKADFFVRYSIVYQVIILYISSVK